MASKKREVAFGSLRCPLLPMFWVCCYFNLCPSNYEVFGRKPAVVLRWTFPQRAIYRRHLYRSEENLNRRRDGRQSQDEFDARERGPTPLPTLTNPPAATPGVSRCNIWFLILAPWLTSDSRGGSVVVPWVLLLAPMRCGLVACGCWRAGGACHS